MNIQIYLKNFTQRKFRPQAKFQKYPEEKEEEREKKRHKQWSLHSASNDQEHHTHFLWTKNTCTSYPGVTESYETDEDITKM